MKNRFIKALKILLGINVDKDDLVCKDLLSHPIFELLTVWTTLRYKNLNIPNPLKNKMGQEYVKTFFTEISKLVTDFGNNYEDYITNIPKMRNRIIHSINNIREISLGNGIPDIFVSKIEKINFTYFNIIIEITASISNSPFYSSYNEKMAAVLDIMLFYTNIKTQDIEQTINQLNGELELALKGSIFDNQ